MSSSIEGVGANWTLLCRTWPTGARDFPDDTRMVELKRQGERKKECKWRHLLQGPVPAYTAMLATISNGPQDLAACTDCTKRQDWRDVAALFIDA